MAVMSSYLFITNLFEDNIFTLFAKDNNNKKMLNHIFSYGLHMENVGMGILSIPINPTYAYLLRRG